MKAIVKVSEEAGAVEVRELPMPEPGPGILLVKMGASGICHSDVMIYKGHTRAARRYPLPLIMGMKAPASLRAGPRGQEPENRGQVSLNPSGAAASAEIV